MFPLVSIAEAAENPAPHPENKQVSSNQIRRYCEWIRDRLLVRADAYVTYDGKGRQYSPLDLAGDRTKKKPLTPQDIIRHARGVQSICLYAIGLENQSKWIAWDFDNHDSDGETHLRNTDYVVHLADVLRTQLGLDPLVESSDGRGGHHVWVLFDDYLPSSLAHRLATWVIEELCDWRRFLKQAPECVPKQPRLTNTCRYGSSLRVPGCHPARKGVWSAILDQNSDRWIPWPDAIDEIITYVGNPAKLIPIEARTYECPERPAFHQPDHRLSDDTYGERLVTSIPELFSVRKTWESILEPHGWQIAQIAGEVKYWRRPGKQELGHSATTGHCDDKLFVFTSNAPPFEAGRAYTKFHAFTVLEHDGDPNAAEADILFNPINGGNT